MNILAKYTLPELRQLAVYMEKFQNCAFIQPEDARRKKDWIISVNQMIATKGLVDPRQYITELRKIIRWFLNHKFKFTRDNQSFFRRMAEEFIYTITEYDICLKERSREARFYIRRVNMDLSNYHQYRFELIDDEPLPVPSPQRQPIQSITSQSPIIDELITDETRALECKICVTNKICVVLVSCGHTFCNSCTTQFNNKCAVCRKWFANYDKVQIYI